jgi:hypothetical protein
VPPQPINLDVLRIARVEFHAATSTTG